MILIKNGIIKTMSKESLEYGQIYIEDGKIKDIGKNLICPQNVQTIDAKGFIVSPGFIDAHTHIGIIEEGVRFEGDDKNELSNPVTPQIRAIDGIKTQCNAFLKALQSGVTSAATGAGGLNPIGGQYAAIKLYGNRIDDMIIKNPVAIKAALGEGPKRAYGLGQQKAPLTRMATVDMIRKLLYDTLAYKKASTLDNGKTIKRDMKLEAMLPIINREIPLKIHAHEKSDIFTAIRIAKEFDINITIEHGTEAGSIAKIIADEGIDVCVGSLFTYRNRYELRNLSYETPKKLVEAGVKIAIITDAPTTPIEYLPIIAGLCIKEGLKEEDAWKAITINPAEILGISNRVGSIERGKDADLVIFNKNPLRNIMAEVMLTVIDGRIVYKNRRFEI